MQGQARIHTTISFAVAEDVHLRRAGAKLWYDIRAEKLRQPKPGLSRLFRRMGAILCCQRPSWAKSIDNMKEKSKTADSDIEIYRYTLSMYSSGRDTPNTSL